MTSMRLFVFFACSLAQWAIADEIVYKVEPISEAEKTKLVFEIGEPIIVRTDIELPAGDYFIRWKVRGDVSWETFEQKRVLVIGAMPGEYEAEFLFIDYSKPKEVPTEKEFIVVVQGSRPPPEPDDTEDDPAPIAGDGFRVLILEEVANRS